MSKRKLTAKQIDILLIAYRFRFITTNNLARHKKITHNSAYSALEILRKNGYLGKKHNKSYRLKNKPASYFLTQQAVNYLIKSNDEAEKEVLKSRMREKTKLAQFIDQQTAIHSAYLDIKEKLGDMTIILVGTQIANVEGTIKPLPSLFIKPKKGRHYFIELTDSHHLFIVKKRIRKYIEHYESDDWEYEEYPDVLIVRRSKAEVRKLNDYVEEKMDEVYLDEEDFSIHISSSTTVESVI